MPENNTEDATTVDTSHRRRMARRFGIALSLVLVVATVLGLSWAVPRMTSEPTMTFSQQDLQAQSDTKLPFRFVTKRGKIPVEVSKVSVEIRDNAIYLDIEASAKKAGKEFSLNATTNGKPRYDAKTGSFFFEPQELTLSNFRVDDEQAGSRTTRVLNALAKVPFIGAKAEEWRERAKEVAHDNVQEALQKYLETHPVYTLPSGSFKKAAMKNVEVKNNTVVLTISLWQITGWVMSWIALGLLAVVLLAVVIACPDVLFILVPFSLFG